MKRLSQNFNTYTTDGDRVYIILCLLLICKVVMVIYSLKKKRKEKRLRSAVNGYF